MQTLAALADPTRRRIVELLAVRDRTVFARDAAGTVYRTYSTYSRGLDLLIGACNLLDLVPKGRDEDPDSPMSWVRHHDRYDHVAVAG